MLEKIIEASIRNRFLVMLVTILLIGVGVYSLLNTSVDAIPDLSDVQVIVYTEYSGQSPRIVEDQVTYPLTTAMVSVPGSKTVRGYSFFGYSLVYVIFEDGTDLYWARSRVLEYLNYAQKRLPEKVIPTLGPDATGVGWVFEYALTSDRHSLQELRSIQDWYLKYELSAIEGVAEVASIGGYVKQYQVTVDPVKLRGYSIPLNMIEMAIRNSNNDVGGEVIEMAESEFMIRGLGYIKSVEDIRNIVLMADKNGTPLLLRDVADVTIGPTMRRGLAELNGDGEAVGGIIVMRSGGNALEVIEKVKQKLELLKAGLPPDVKIVPVYDRSGLIERAIETLKEKLTEEIIIVALVCLIFLLHARSAMVAIFTLPTAILIAFIIMKQQGINANIMSLGGIAIAIGAMVDAAIIMIENAHKHIEHERLKPPDQQAEHWTIILNSSKEVGPALFYSLLVITISFIPVFTLGEQSGRLFHPLAFTKTYSMAAAAILGITIVPILMGYFVRGKILPEDRNPINRLLIRLYHPVVQSVLKHPKMTLLIAVILIGVTVFPFMKLGSEFMPPLYEGDILYMPTTLPGISITKAKEILQQTDKIIRTFPEVHHVFGKVGRAETATDPAGLDMIETTIMLKPENEWRPGVTVDKLISEMDQAIQFPGLTNAWTMPIKTRTDMLSTGIKTPVGIKISGPNLDTLQEIGKQVEAVIRRVPGTLSAFAERAVGGNYLDFEINRHEIARYGLTINDVQVVIQTAIGGMSISNTVEGLERYSVNLRYGRELRDNIEALKNVLIASPAGLQIPLGQLAEIRIRKGPMVIRSEDTRPNAWVYVDIKNIDLAGYVKSAQTAVGHEVHLPAGYNVLWSGEYEYLLKAEERLRIVIPMTILIIFIILYMNTKSFVKTGIVFLAVPFSLIGAVWYLYWLDYNLSMAVWVGMIALAGLDAETGVVMLLYLDQAYDAAKKSGGMKTHQDLITAIDHGAVKRVRPKIMTAAVIVAGLLPILWSHGAGSDVMKRIAAPMVGGVITSVLMELAVYPVIFYLWKKRNLRSTG
ncbi:MAG TPA: CusA/CzcA family heavy metal efflux RND transporter [Cyclobacteriaceae bacterium]|nr:CusA/CzcA family heavy metal efflux RND transporter [Cyclobacteriaceae bacterium]HNA14668.1 CusA/CzcA family heavy metal efflux RND transporter [Cyclobacteriaceae bacterium]HNC30461.1 CusA/CzcA family heavy metal efflux RND transporter [Cyclobacteriaceae bacterium]HND44345.1 CusA/CzcA family heavy metal efflux RND transporter [Cyclobacteriaceae bacterium]